MQPPRPINTTPDRSYKDDLTREVVFNPGYNKRAEGKGVHGLEITFLVKGPHGAVAFEIDTGWVPGEPLIQPRPGYYPRANDLGYHSHRPSHADELPCTGDCRYIGGACYYGGTTSGAEPFLRLLINEGHEPVWKKLEQAYLEVYGQPDNFLGEGI